MCSKSSYLPSLEGMPCKIWLAMCSMPAIDFWRPFLLVLWAALRGHIDRHLLISARAWPPTSTTQLSPARSVTSSEAATRAPPLWWHVHSRGHMADWLYAEEGNWSQADPALLLQQMGEAWHSIFRQMPPPYSTCLQVGHCTERTVCLMMKEQRAHLWSAAEQCIYWACTIELLTITMNVNCDRAQAQWEWAVVTFCVSFILMTGGHR